MQRADDSLVLIDGPWRHRGVDANGSRFHVAETGDGPLVLLLHGFGEFWWTWRHQLAPLAAAGYRAVAVDLRGYGGSDKPPRGYDGYTLAADIAGLVRALGERDAAVVGHDLGGYLAWSTACLHPRTVRQLALVGSARPRIADLRRDRDFALFQLPRYEHRLTSDGGAAIGTRLRTRSGPQWTRTADFAAYEPVCRQAFGIRQAAFCALEYHRWAGRSMVRPSGWRFARLLATPLAQPVLQLHGEADPYVLPATAAAARTYADGPYEWQLVPGVGHFPHAEAPAEVTAHLIRWLAT
ncbi:alpha/beta fold hydrolase [Fodinicola acaciae]|uniref:alpha/beta fold hydrolase n=1 Tax=Fodinicola acaciae TaxID=2681555 RepID=UPI0013D2A13B|nr:alpha/beta hydrolase [Fodinicola acaciae]